MISRVQLSALLLLAASAWGIAIVLEGVQVTAVWFRPFSIVLGVLVLLLGITDRWLWRVRWLRPWLFKVPLVQGTWKATIRPTAPDGAPRKVEAFMVIRQTLSTVSLRLLTAESQSETLSARVVGCEDGVWRVAAVYRNTPRLQVRSRSPLHHGALLLDVQGDPAEAMTGQYWTDRLSQGEISLSARHHVLAHAFDQARQIWHGEEAHEP
jgi:hypothetical protein